MKRTNFNLKSSTFILFAALLFAFSGCDTETILDERTDGVILAINPDVVLTPLNVQVIDANTGEVPTGVQIDLVDGPVDRIFNQVGIQGYEVIEGIASFSLAYGDGVSVDEPIEMTVRASAPGYVTTTQRVVIDEFEGFRLYQVPLVNRMNLPEGTSAASATLTSVAGVGTTDETSISTAATSNVAQTATVTWPVGTRFFDGEGNELSGTINAEIVYFSSENETTLEAFPGGLGVQNAVDANGNSLGDGYFFSAGFVAIDLTAGGTVVKSFSQPVGVEMDVALTAFNPETNTSVEVGDEIPVWSLNENTGQWTQEEIITIENGSNGQLLVNFEITHLSYYNLDFFRGSCRLARVSIASNLVDATEGLRVKIFDANSGNYLTQIYGRPRLLNGDVLNLFNVPNRSVILKYYRGTYGCSTLIGQSDPVNLCSNPTLNVSIPPPSGSVLNIEGVVSGVCDNGSNGIEVRPNANILFRGESTCNQWRWFGRIYRGQLTQWSSLTAEELYDFGVYYAGNVYSYNGLRIAPGVYGQGDFEVEISQNGDVLSFDLTRTPLAESTCDVLGF